jgi:hypothetical protein
MLELGSTCMQLLDFRHVEDLLCLISQDDCRGESCYMLSLVVIINEAHILICCYYYYYSIEEEKLVKAIDTNRRGVTYYIHIY